MTTKKVYIASNGCNRRLLDARRLHNYFEANGYKVTENPKEAGFILFFASALNQVRISESFNIIKKLKNYNGEVIVLGCLMETAPAAFRSFWKGKAFAVKDMDKIDTVFPDITVPYAQIPYANKPYPVKNIYKTISPLDYLGQGVQILLTPQKVADKVYSYLHASQKENYGNAFIWVSKGCPNLCSFCAERKVVGPLISRPVEEIVGDYQILLEQGHRNFEFIGDDVGSYGLDSGSNFSALIAKLNETDKGFGVNWVIKHLHPKYTIRYRHEILDLAKSGKIKEIICCFQSGSNRLLKLMNRQHTIEEVVDTLNGFKKALPDIRFATNIIVGFPTETDEEFMQTLSVFDSVYFDRVHMIKYYDAEGSDSFSLVPKVPDKVVAQRIALAKSFLKKRGVYFQTRD